jgi:hypothetical protein
MNNPISQPSLEFSPIWIPLINKEVSTLQGMSYLLPTPLRPYILPQLLTHYPPLLFAVSSPTLRFRVSSWFLPLSCCCLVSFPLHLMLNNLFESLLLSLVSFWVSCNCYCYFLQHLPLSDPDPEYLKLSRSPLIYFHLKTETTGFRNVSLSLVRSRFVCSCVSSQVCLFCIGVFASLRVVICVWLCHLLPPVFFWLQVFVFMPR